MRSVYFRCLGLLILLGLGCAEVAPTNPFDPEAPDTIRAKATIRGTIVRNPCAAETAVPAQGVSVAIFQNEESVQSTQTDETGAFVLRDLAEGNYVIRTTLERYGAASQAVVGRAGAETRIEQIILEPLRGSIEGEVRRVGGAGGGSTVYVRGNPDDPEIATFQAVTPAAPGSGRFVVDDLCPGAYSVTAVSDGYRTPEATEVQVALEDAAPYEVDLVQRRFSLGVSSVTVNPGALAFGGDEDLVFARYWTGAPTPPEGLAFVALNAERTASLELPEPGENQVYAQLATAQATDDDVSNDLYAFISPVMSGLIRLDEASPTLDAVRHLPETGADLGFVAYEPGGEISEGAIEIIAHDEQPSSGLSTVVVSDGDGAAEVLETAFRSRLSVPLAQPGWNHFTVTVADGAGNQSEASTVSLFRDDHQPTGQILAADELLELEEAQGVRLRTNSALQPPVTAEQVVNIEIGAADADADLLAEGQGGLMYRMAVGQVGEVNINSAPWEAVPDVTPFTRAVALPGGRDGLYAIEVEVKDLSGKVWNLGTVSKTVRLDRTNGGPTALRVHTGGEEIGAGSRVRLEPDAADGYRVAIEVTTAGQEPMFACIDSCLPSPEARDACEIVEGQAVCEIDVALPGVVDGAVEVVDLSVVTVDVAGNQSEPMDFSFTVDLSPPSNTTVEFAYGVQLTERGVGLTNRRDGAGIGLLVNAADAVAYRLHGGVTNGGAIVEQAAFPVEVAVVLDAATDGEKRILVDFFDAVGNETTEEVTIILDTEGPTFDVGLLSDGEPVAVGGDALPRIVDPDVTVQVSLTAPDPDCASLAEAECALQQRVSLSDQFVGAIWTQAQSAFEFRFPAVSGPRSLYVQLRDVAGNISAPTRVQLDVDVNLVVDLDGPDTPGLRRDYIGPNKIRLEVTAPADADLGYYVIERNVPDVDGAQWKRIKLTPAIADDDSFGVVSPACRVQSADCDGAETCLPAFDREVLLVEDRSLYPGLVHMYRIRAYDDLGNPSSVSIPLDAGVPIEPPFIRLLTLGDQRIVSWVESPGTFLVESVMYERRDLSGTLIHEEELPAGSGQARLDVLDPDEGLVQERVSLRAKNADQSIIWETSIEELGLARRNIEPEGGSGAYVTGAEDSTGLLHTVETHDGYGPLVYRQIRTMGRDSSWRYDRMSTVDGQTLELKARAMSISISPDDVPYVLFYNLARQDDTIYVAPLGGNGPILTDAMPLQSGMCGTSVIERRERCGYPQLGVWTSIAHDVMGNLHTAFASLGSGGLYYAKWRRGEAVPDEVVTVDEGPLVGHSTKLTLFYGVFPFIYYGSGLAFPNLGGDEEFVRSIWLGFIGSPDPMLLPKIAMLEVPKTVARMLDVTLTDEGVDHLIYTTNGTDLIYNRTGSPQIVAEDIELRAPRVTILDNGQALLAYFDSPPLGIGAPSPLIVSTPGADGIQSEIMARVHASNPAYMDLITGPSGRLRAVFDNENGAIGLATNDSIVDQVFAEPETLVAPSCSSAGGMLHSASDVHGGLHLAYTDQSGRLLYRSPGSGERPGEVLVGVPGDGCLSPAPDDGPGRVIELAVSLTRPVVYFLHNQRYEGNRLYLTEFNRSNGEVSQTLIEDDARFDEWNITSRLNAAGLMTDESGILHMAFPVNDCGDGNCVRYRRLQPDGTSSDTLFYECADAQRVHFVSGLDGLRLVCERDAILEDHNGIGVRAGVVEVIDLSDVDVVRSERLILSGQMFDVIALDTGGVGGLAKGLYFAWADPPNLYVGRSQEEAVLVSRAFEHPQNVVALSATESGGLQVVYTETQLNGDILTQSIRYRNLERSVPGPAITLRTIEAELSDVRQNLRLFGIGTRSTATGLDLVYQDIRVDEDGAGGGLFHRRLRPNREPSVTHRRVDGIDSLGQGGDLDEDGLPGVVGGVAVEDRCEGVWSPENPFFDICSVCAEGAVDLDMDGVVDEVDNCPVHTNRLQADGDEDGQGDACDEVDENLDLFLPTGCTDTEQLETDADLVAVVVSSTADGGMDFDLGCGHSHNSADRVYSFRVPSTGRWQFTTAGSAYDTVIGLVSHCDSTHAQVLGCNDDGGGFGSSLVYADLEEGDVAFVVVDGYRGDGGEFVLQAICLDCDDAPDADEDGIHDAIDNCPDLANVSQVDADGDGVGDACEPPLNPECVGMFHDVTDGPQAGFGETSFWVFGRTDTMAAQVGYFSCMVNQVVQVFRLTAPRAGTWNLTIDAVGAYGLVGLSGDVCSGDYQELACIVAPLDIDVELDVGESILIAFGGLGGVASINIFAELAQECDRDSDCGEGMVCTYPWVDCGLGDICKRNVCEEAPPECAEDGDCDRGQTCEAGSCEGEVLNDCDLTEEITDTVADAQGAYVIAGTTTGAESDYRPSCGQFSQREDIIYRFTPPSDGDWTFSTAGTDWDTVLELRTGCDDGEILSCNDDFGDDRTSSITETLVADVPIYVVVDSDRAFNGGDFTLTVSPEP